MSITDLVSGLRNSGASWLPALIVAAAALGVLAFVYIGHEVGEEELVQFDSSILLAFRDPADLRGRSARPGSPKASSRSRRLADIR